MENAAQGRELKYIRLYKPDGSSLGFSVVGLRSEHKGELGIYVQEIQSHGIAGKDGQLQEGDQILAIDGQPTQRHQDAINILQMARGTVDLIVARNYPEDAEESYVKEASASNKEADPGVPSDWCQVEIIELINNGSGLGFGIIGGNQSGVIVKTIVPDGVADQDGRLRPNDFILQINENWLHGVGIDQVKYVLGGTGSHVRLIVARPVNDPNINSSLPVVPSSLLTNRNELERHLGTDNTDMMSESPLKSNLVAPTPSVPGSHEMPEMITLDVELVKDSKGLGKISEFKRFFNCIS